jgi:diguanylate cyclase (GGDEF)-like protein
LRQKIKEREEHESYLVKKAYFDPLTNLPNKQNLEIMLEEQIHRTKRHKKSFVVAFIKILNYRDITLRSKAIADAFIVEASDRITESIRNEDILVRIGESSFVILCNEYLPEENSEIIFDRIQNAFQSSFELNSKTTLEFKISIGKAVYPRESEDSETLINLAKRKALKNL